MRFRFLFVLIAAVVAWTGAVQAQNSVERAAQIWLEGRDQESLTLLAALSRNGDARARILLARIETTDLGPSPFRMSLSKEDARTLFRDTSGPTPFGRSWLAVEAVEGNEYAHAFLRAAQPYPRPGLIRRLHKLNETQAADHPTRILALYGAPEVTAEVRNSDFMMDELKPFVDYLAGTPEPRGDGLAALRHVASQNAGQITPDTEGAIGMAAVLALGFGYGDHSAENPWRTAVEDWLLNADATQPIANLCNGECGAAPGKCVFAFMTLMGGYYEAIRIDSPFENVIPQAEFVKSTRARLMVLRRAALARTETNLDWLSSHAEIAEISSCAADLVMSERSEYKQY